MLERKFEVENEINLDEIILLKELVNRENYCDELSKIVYAYKLGKQVKNLDYFFV